MYWRHCSEISTDVQDRNDKANAVAANHLPAQGFIESTYGLNFLHFIETVISGVNTLYCNGKKNLPYIFAKILSEDKLKLDRMPFGLIDYNLRFVHAESAVKLEMEYHYAVWQETMLAHFGHKWIALNQGPMWQYDEDDCTPGTVKENVATFCDAPVSNDILPTSSFRHRRCVM